MSSNSRVINKLTLDQQVEVMNEMAHEFLSGNLMDSYSPIEANPEYLSVTVPENIGEPFALEPITSGAVKILDVDKTENKVGVARIAIGYLVIMKYMYDENRFRYETTIIVNAMLIALSKKFGSLKGKYVIAELPGQPGCYFRVLSDTAGIEFRVTVLQDKI